MFAIKDASLMISDFFFYRWSFSPGNPSQIIFLNLSFIAFVKGKKVGRWYFDLQTSWHEGANIIEHVRNAGVGISPIPD